MTSELSKRLEVAMLKYTPEGFDPATDDMTIQFAFKLAEKDAEIARLKAEVASKSEQIGKLYTVCNERAVLHNENERLRAEVATLTADLRRVMCVEF